MSNIIGIDLGTTYSAIAKLDDSGHPIVIPVDGERTLPSCVLVDSENKILVGKEAKSEVPFKLGSILQRFKRDMGSDETYKMECGVELTPVSASAIVLKKLCQDASKSEGEIKDVVITVPANFAESSRKATMSAGVEAGLNVLNIINEPTAAVIAYATKHQMNGNVMVYDLGGGTFDVTIAKVDGTEVQCLTSEGDSDLGGIDFDYKLAEIIDQKYEAQHGRTLRDTLGLSGAEAEKESLEWTILLERVEELKRSLSKVEAKSFLLNQRGNHDELQCEVTRQEFNSAIQGLVARAEMRIETAMDNLNMTAKDIDVVLLVGGSTRVPLVMESVKRIMGKDGSQEVNPDEAVALGAAIYAGLKSAPEKLKPMQRASLADVKIGDVANHYFGTIARNFDEHTNSMEEKVSIILRKDRPVPCSNTETFRTASDDQQWIGFKLTQSAEEETDPQFVNVVFEEDLGPLPAGRPKGQPVEFTFSYDEDQVMWVELKDVTSGKVFKATPHQLSDSEREAVSIPSFTID
ncbi:MAG: Hsp70 family protein [Akkermansiaceae bacterium]